MNDQRRGKLVRVIRQERIGLPSGVYFGNIIHWNFGGTFIFIQILRLVGFTDFLLSFRDELDTIYVDLFACDQISGVINSTSLSVILIYACLCIHYSKRRKKKKTNKSKTHPQIAVVYHSCCQSASFKLCYESVQVFEVLGQSPQLVRARLF